MKEKPGRRESHRRLQLYNTTTQWHYKSMIILRTRKTQAFINLYSSSSGISRLCCKQINYSVLRSIVWSFLINSIQFQAFFIRKKKETKRTSRILISYFMPVRTQLGTHLTLTSTVLHISMKRKQTPITLHEV